MEKPLTLPKPSNKNFVASEKQLGFECDTCRVTFVKPILATVSSNGSFQSYYACPRCLSKIHVKEEKESVVFVRKIRKVKEKQERVVECKHFFGFLKKRQKDSPIPDECLTCSKMIECLTQ